MAIPLPMLMAGASLVGSFFDSQKYYPAAEAPTKTQLLGDAIGGAVGGYLGAGALGGGQQAGGGQAAPAAAAGGIDPQLLQVLTNGGFSGQGVGQQQQQPQGNAQLAQIMQMLGQQQPQQQQQQTFQPQPTGLGMFGGLT